jgi:hypothetical protein
MTVVFKNKEERETIEKLMKDLGYKQFDRNTLTHVFRQIQADRSLATKYGLSLNKVNEYQRKYGVNDTQQKGMTGGLDIQKHFALKKGGSIFLPSKRYTLL